MNTLIKSILFAGAVLFSQASFALYLDGGIGSADIDGPAEVTVNLPGGGSISSGGGDSSETYIKIGQDSFELGRRILGFR
jgi:hypothetical protein